jgi:hypothetical protein
MPDRLVRGNEASNRIFEWFAPLRATRALGVLDQAKLKTLGLADTKKSLAVVSGGQTRRFALAPAPQGGSEPYIRDEQDGRVFIIRPQILSDLQAATTNLVERRLHKFPTEDIDRMVVTAGPKKQEYRASRVGPQVPGIRLAKAETPGAPVEAAKNWHERVWELFPSEVLGQGESPAEGAPVVAVKIEYHARRRQLGWLELARVSPSSAPSVSLSAPAPNFPVAAYGRSEFTHGWTKLPDQAMALIDEGEKLVKQ